MCIYITISLRTLNLMMRLLMALFCVAAIAFFSAALVNSSKTECENAQLPSALIGTAIFLQVVSFFTFFHHTFSLYLTSGEHKSTYSISKMSLVDGVLGVIFTAAGGYTFITAGRIVELWKDLKDLTKYSRDPLTRARYPAVQGELEEVQGTYGFISAGGMCSLTMGFLMIVWGVAMYLRYRKVMQMQAA